MAKKNDFNIVSDQEKKSNSRFLAISVIVGLLCVVVIIGILAKKFLVKENKEVDYTQKESYQKDYDNLKNIYAEMGIEYSEEDYKQDLKAQDAKPNGDEGENGEGGGVQQSVAAQKMQDNNQKELDEMKENTKWADLDLNEIKQTIIKQVGDYNKFITDHAGLPDNEYDDFYSGAKEYNDSIINYLVTGETFENNYENKSIQSQANSMLYCIFTQSQFGCMVHGEYKEVLTGYMKLGYPKFSNISMISVNYNNESDFKKFDNFTCSLTANIIADGNKYKVYLCPKNNSLSGIKYYILDIE